MRLTDTVGARLACPDRRYDQQDSNKGVAMPNHAHRTDVATVLGGWGSADV